MKISFKNMPIGILLCMLWSLILIPVSLLNVEETIRAVLGLPFILFIPGYILIFALFPARKTDRGIDIMERIALSFGFSIAIVPLIGLVLNYTPWGIRLESILVSISLFIMVMGIIAIYKWKKTKPNERFSLIIHLSLPQSQNKLDYALNIILLLSIIIAIVLPVTVLMTPKTAEKFTEFYLLGLDNNTEEYSKNLIMGVNVTRTIEIVNHEYETINYTVEIWLINQSVDYNRSENGNRNVIDNMWFVDKITTTLEHTDVVIGKPSNPQWGHNYSFAINRLGSFKLMFLLFKTSTEKYNRDENYKDIAEQKISNAYREIHQWINVYYYTPPKANLTYSPNKPTINDTIYFTSNSTSPYSRIASWKWDFGDGNTSSGETIGLGFDGIDDYVDCGNNASLQPVNGTVEAWIYPKEFNGTKIIFTDSGSYARRHPNFRLEGNALLLMITNNTHREMHGYKADFKTNTWYHVAATWNGSNVSFYINGSLKETQNQDLLPAGNTVPKRIGALSPPKWPEAFNGTIKDLKIYNRALNSTEIQNNYKGNIATNSLVSWWKMNEKGNIAYDSIGKNDGTIHGANWINQAVHTYSHPGTYQVKLTITNEYGQIHSVSKYITIS